MKKSGWLLFFARRVAMHRSSVTFFRLLWSHFRKLFLALLLGKAKPIQGRAFDISIAGFMSRREKEGFKTRHTR